MIEAPVIELGWGGQLDEGFQKFSKSAFENNNERHQNQLNPEVVPINGKFLVFFQRVFSWIFRGIFGCKLTNLGKKN